MYKDCKFVEASKLFADALNRFEAAGNSVGIVSAGVMLGYCYQRLRRYREAVRAYESATGLPPPQPIDTWLLALQSLGYCQAKLKNFSSATETFVRLSQICKENGKHDGSARALTTLANILLDWVE